MSYIAEHIDTEKFEAGLDSHKRYQEELQRTSIEKANAQYEGYCKCLEDVRSMLHCSNYESKEKEAAAYKEGADAAFYELCKELGIGVQDIRDKNISIDQKAYMVAERIKETLCNETPGEIDRVGVKEFLPAIKEEKAAQGDRETMECFTWVRATERLPEDDQGRKGMFKKVIVWARGKWFECAFDPKTKKFICGLGYEQHEVENVDYWAIPVPPSGGNKA